MMTDPCTTILKEYLNGIKQVGSFHNIGISAWKKPDECMVCRYCDGTADDYYICESHNY